MRLDGFGLLVEDMAKMIRFYRDVLGFEYVKGLNGHSEIALYVDTFDEVDAAFKNAVENGATPVLEPELEPWGCCVPVARVQHRPSREARPENLLYCRSGRKFD